MTSNRQTGSVGTWVVFIICLVVVFALGLLMSNISERRTEARLVQVIKPIAKYEMDSSKWKANYPRQYDRYKLMHDSTTKTKYGGSDPRDYLKGTTANVILFAGYGFSVDYLQARGHVYTIEDFMASGRIKGKHDKFAATCWTCKGPDVPRVMAELGAKKVKDPENATLQELVLAGAGDFYNKKIEAWTKEITHPIGCFDCHDPDDMTLRISRPALIEAFQRQGKDINDASQQEMRSLVCAQCHVEYYFKGDGKYLTFPWDQGTGLDQMEKYYNDAGFKDWTHAISKAPMVKMQHPDYEVYKTGIHAYRDVSCADCHMPYVTEGGAKFTDHFVRSPLLNIANSCAVCHRWGEEEILNRVQGIQDKVREGRTRAEASITKAHFDIAACMQAGATDEELKELRELVRSAQVRWDYVAANNGMGFHSPQECMRALMNATDTAQQCRILAARILAARGYNSPVNYPDISTKEKAQTLIKLFINGTPPNLLGKPSKVAAK